MAYTTLVAGTTITASWGNASVRDQVVTPFASAAARTSAITVPVEGMLSYLADTDSLWVYQGAAWVPAADHSFADAAARTTAVTVPVDGMLSTLTTTDRVDVYNGASWSALVAPSNGALTSWTPVVVQGATPTLTNNGSTMIRMGRMVFFQSTVTITSSATAATLVTMTTPVTTISYAGQAIIGYFKAVDTSSVIFSSGHIRSNSTTTMKFEVVGSGSADGQFIGTVVDSDALANGDTISVFGFVEAAADG